jgi:glycosyltransferase involved in cell wall biosynthesis
MKGNNRIAFVIHSLKIGGSERFFLDMVNELGRSGFNPLVVLLERQNPLIDQLNEGIERVVIPRRFKYDIFVSFKIKKLLSDKEVDRIFCVEPYSFFLSRLANYFNPVVRYYLSLHNSIPIGRKKYLLELLYLRFFRASDTAIFICHYQREYFLRKYLFSPLHAMVIYNGVDTDRYAPRAAERELTCEQLAWKSRLGIGEKEPVVLMIGRISLEKGHCFALRALKQLQIGHGIKAHLVIVGNGSSSLLADLKALSAGLGIERYVHFEGGQQEVRHYLLQADVFALTSVSETFSLAALEALSMGAPCSLTDVGGAAEMLTTQTGDLCKARDITSIASSWAGLLMAGCNREYIRMNTVNRFSHAVMLSRYMSVFQENTFSHEKR